jgi:hypothetical protein
MANFVNRGLQITEQGLCCKWAFNIDSSEFLAPVTRQLTKNLLAFDHWIRNFLVHCKTIKLFETRLPLVIATSDLIECFSSRIAKSIPLIHDVIVCFGHGNLRSIHFHHLKEMLQFSWLGLVIYMQDLLHVDDTCRQLLSRVNYFA